MATKSSPKKDTVGVRELRENLDMYVNEIAKGRSFTVFRRSTPVFRITPPDEETAEAHWNLIADFTEVDSEGVAIADILKALK